MDTADFIEAKIGSHAPDFRLPSTDGRQVALSDYRHRSNVVLFFVREFTCMECRAHVTQLGRMAGDFRKAGAEIVVILGDTMERARQYTDVVHSPFPILSDPERQVYAAYELEKFFSLIQRTASLVIDQAGVIRYLKSTTLPYIWLQESREIFGFVDSLSETSNLAGPAH
jgi:peroxiredoxin